METAGSASLYSGTQNFDNADSYLSLVYLYIMRQLRPEALMLIPGLPDAVKNAAMRYKIRISECSAEEMYRSNTDEINRLLADPLYFSISLAAHLSNEGITLDEFAKEVPLSRIAEREISCEWKDIGKAIRMLYEANRDALCVEGIKVYSNKGWGFILPREDEPKISIRAEGFKEEYSRELCDFYAEELKKYIKS